MSQVNEEKPDDVGRVAEVEVKTCDGVVDIVEQVFTQILKHSGKSVRVYGTPENPWFCAKDIAAIFYSNGKQAISGNVQAKHRKTIGELSAMGIKFKPEDLRGHMPRLILLSEPGMLLFITGSNKPEAHILQDWVFEEVIPSIRRTGGYHLNQRIQRLASEVSHLRLTADDAALRADAEQKRADEAHARAEAEQKRADDIKAELVAAKAKQNLLHTLNSGLLESKRFVDKKERIYIVASEHYSSQGIFKVGRTIDMKQRSPGHNNTRIIGDKFVVLNSYPVNDATVVEYFIHHMLRHILVADSKEMFKAPYLDIVSVVEHCVECEASANTKANDAVMNRYALERDEEFNSASWTRGIAGDVFGPLYYLPAAYAAGKISYDALTPETKLGLARLGVAEYIKKSRDIDFVLSVPVVPRLEVKWSEPFNIIKNHLQRGDGTKMAKAQGEWSALIGQALQGSSGIDYKPLKQQKAKDSATVAG